MEKKQRSDEHGGKKKTSTSLFLSPLPLLNLSLSPSTPLLNTSTPLLNTLLEQLLYPDTIPSALSRNTSQRVAIIGGGAAGLTAAATLQQLGYKDVVVFESDPKVGGKCLSVEIDGEFYDLGAIQLSSTYFMVSSLAAATKTPFHRFYSMPKSEVGASNSSSPNVTENVEVLAGVAALAATTKRYLREVKAPGMLQASQTASLAGVSFSEFAVSNRFGAPMTNM